MGAVYEPLPLVSPWNSGSGFARNGKSAEAERSLQKVLDSDDPRLAQLKSAVQTGFDIVRAGHARGWAGANGDLWDKAYKAEIMTLCRNLLPDESIAWLDATAAAAQNSSGEAALAFSRILGTGGNFGRQELQANYIDRALTVLAGDIQGRSPRPVSGWLLQMLTGREGLPYLREAVGQFDPGRAGGVSSSGGEDLDKEGFLNPWSFLFIIEGALFFTAGVVRRQGTLNTGTALPFQVRPANIGYGTAAPLEDVKAELWLPEWDESAGIEEITQIFREARSQWNGRTAGTGLDQARALSSRGVAQGLTRFRRVVVAERFGQNPFAVVVDTVPVQHRSGVQLTQGLDRWRQQLRSLTHAPQEVQRGLRAVDASILAFSRGKPGAIIDVLCTVARLHTTISRSGAVRAVVRPLILRDLTGWVAAVFENSPEQAAGAEFRMALAYASTYETKSAAISPLRCLLSAIEPTQPTQGSGKGPRARVRLAWSNRPPLIEARDMPTRLGHVHRRLAHTPLPDPLVHSDRPAVQGRITRWQGSTPVSPHELIRFVQGNFDDDLFAQLLTALLLFAWTSEDRENTARMVDASGDRTREAHQRWWPRPLALLLPFYAFGPQEMLLRPDHTWPARLCAGRVNDVSREAHRRLRISGAGVPRETDAFAAPTADGKGGVRLAAALFAPATSGAYREALQQIVPSFKREDSQE
ncbi:hypothetical protein Kisp02_14630 [Kineosporia sp. NBRC 101731]|nr:hypothetical protein Kisp02_14630 [Kineosporia sp. NBRC 101731]